MNVAGEGKKRNFGLSGGGGGPGRGGPVMGWGGGKRSGSPNRSVLKLSWPKAVSA